MPLCRGAEALNCTAKLKTEKDLQSYRVHIACPGNKAVQSPR